jgi:hypothetical protein
MNLLSSAADLPGDVIHTTDRIVVGIGDAADQIKPLARVLIRILDASRYIGLLVATGGIIWAIRVTRK